MRINSIFFIASIYLFSIPFQGCTRDIVLESGEKPAVVVECILTQDSIQELRLSYAKTPSQKEADYLTEAKATLKDLTDQLAIGDFTRVSNDIWQLGYTPVAGHKYRLEIKVNGYDDIFAEDSMVENFSFKWLEHSPWSSVLLSTFSDMNSPSDYRFTPTGIFYNVMSMPDFLWAYGYDIDETGGEENVIEEICTDYPYIDNFNLTGKDYDSQKDKGFVFNSLDGYAMHKKFIRFHSEPRWDDSPDNEHIYFTISGDFSNVSTSANERYKQSRKNSFIRFMSVSESYDTYLRDAYKNILNQQSSDLSFIYTHENSYTNITGGRGIFATVATTDAPWWCNTSYIAF